MSDIKWFKVEVYKDSEFKGWLYDYMGLDDTVWDTINSFEKAYEFRGKQHAYDLINKIESDDYMYCRKLDNTFTFRLVRETQYRHPPVA